MPITLGTNIASMGAQRQLARTNDKLTSAFTRLSSGQRINRAVDDAAGLAVSATINSDTRIFNQAVRNINDGVSALNIADEAIANLSTIVSRQSELAEQASNGIYSSTQRAAMDREAQSLYDEYARIVSTTKFNGLKLIDGSVASLYLQAGYGSDAILAANILPTSGGGAVTDAGTVTTTNIALNNLGGGITDTRFLIGDLNSDGIADIITLSATVDGTLEGAQFDIGVYLGRSSGSISFTSGTSQYYYAPGEQTGVNITSATLVDSNLDGKKEIRIRYVANSDLGFINVDEREEFSNTTVGTSFNMDFSFDDNLSPASNTLVAGGNSVADFNGDGINDNLSVTGTGFSVGIHNTTGSPLTVDDLTQSSFLLTTQSGARTALDGFRSLLSELSQARGRIGASLSRIASTNSVLQTTTTNLAAAQSRIMSADAAVDSAELTRSSILRDVGSAVLVQANQQPAIALELLRG